MINVLKFHLFSNKMLIFRARIGKFAVGIVNREDPDQTASCSLNLVCAVCLGLFGRQLVFEI